MAVVVSNVKDLKGVQKAAILMIALGDDISAEIFKCLEEDEIPGYFARDRHAETHPAGNRQSGG